MQRAELGFDTSSEECFGDGGVASPIDYKDVETRHAASRLIVPVILSGGGGSRLWPLSTDVRPKQFLQLAGPESLFQQALRRVEDRLQFAAPIIVGSARYGDLCERELAGQSSEARLILEPCSRNTAPAAVMAAALARDLHGKDAVLLVMPSDHVISDVAAFHEAIQRAVVAARAGRLVTFGIDPSGPETGYGYLERGPDIEGAPGVQEVVRFVEKPELAVAEGMVAGGRHLWNSGIFLFQAETFLDEVASVCPEIGRSAQAAVALGKTAGLRVSPDAAFLAECPSESIDYAVMERSTRVAVVPMSPGWSDVGSWDALAGIPAASTSGEFVTALDCTNCYIRSDGVQVAALGVRDIIVVAAGNRLLILPKGRSQEVKRLLAEMENPASASGS